MDEKEARIKNLRGIRDCLYAFYFGNSIFKNDLAEIIKALKDRIELIRKGKV